MTVIPFDARKERFTIKIKLQEIWMGIGADARSKMLVFCCVSSSPVNSPENPNETSAPMLLAIAPGWGLFRVKSGVLTVGRSLPVHADNPTFQVSVACIEGAINRREAISHP
jgi:hypothetical protein